MATGVLTHQDAANFYEAGGSGIKSWIFSTDHKRIGIMYFYTIVFFFMVIGVPMGLLMRTELIAPGRTLFGPQMYNSVLTLHGVVMIFLVIIPSVPAAFGNFIMPLQIGARDVLFPRLNLLSFYLLVIGALLAVIALFWGFNPPDTGWTFYAPFSTTTETNVPLTVFAAFVIGFSSILTGLNFIATIHRLRAPGVSWFKMPLFCWALYATAWVQVIATPVVGITLLMVIAERLIGASVFDASRGGDPILYQHLFWIYSHPAVYIMILPPMGVVSEIIPTFCKKRIFGYSFIAMSSIAIASIGSLVWGHHMFTSGMADEARFIFSLLTYFVAIPSAIKVFNWIATMYGGSIEVKPPMVFCLMFIFLFMIGGFTGLMQAAVTPDVHYHDTYFIVAHFHYVMFGSGLIIFFAAMHYWWPKVTGKMYSHKLANISAGLIFVGFNVTYFPMFVMGHRGMPRRYYDYDKIFWPEHLISTIGSYILTIGLFMMFWNVLFRKGTPCGKDPWGGSTLEWEVASPPIGHNFHEIPVWEKEPYDYTEYAEEQRKLQEEKNG